MTTNSFFDSHYGYDGEQNLYDDLIREQIAMYGFSLYYMPRLNNHIDFLFKESPVSTFEIATTINCYVESFDGFTGTGGGMEILSKFGIRNSDQITLVCSRTDYETEMKDILDEYFTLKNIDTTNPLLAATTYRPREGDLIYLPFDQGLFTIKYVDYERPFFAFNTTLKYKLVCERFEYTGERINILVNPIPEINELLIKSNLQRYTGTLVVGGTGTFQLLSKVYIHSNSNNLDGAITADLYEFSSTDRTFTVSGFSNLDPADRNNVTFDVDWDQYNGYYMSNADRTIQWRINTIQEQVMPGDSSVPLQNEFDVIKVVDTQDDNAFGFY
jgi:hypothetical protein